MWIIFALLNPISDATRNIFSKKASLRVDPLLVAWFNNLIPLIAFTPVIFFITFKFNSSFWESIIISGTLNIAGTILYHRAISKGDISKVVPLLSFTPFFLLFLSPLIVNEFPDFTGAVGTILIVIGSYLLNINLKKEGIFSPIKSLVKDKGNRYMLLVSFLMSISANFDKVGIVSSSVFQYTFIVNLYICLGITLIALIKRKLNFKEIKLEGLNLSLVGVFTSLAYFLHMTAISLTLVVYVVSLKRTAGMITVIYGAVFFKEQNIKNRLTGSIIMFVGVLLIVLF